MNPVLFSSKSAQHPAVELLLFENYSLSSSRLSSKNNRIFERTQKTRCVCRINGNENDAENEK